MANYKSDAYQEGYNARRRKQKKDNTYMTGSSGYAEYERGWNDHRLGVGKQYVAPPAVKIPKTYVGFCIDRSGSMSYLTKASTNALNDQINQLKSKVGQNIFVSLNSFGGDIRTHITNQPVHSVYTQSGFNASGQTPLFDAVGKMIGELQSVPDAKDNDVAFMVLILTDGFENASHVWNSFSVNKQIQELQATDRWTFAFLVPPGSKSNFANQFGVPAQNVMEWEATEAGVKQYNQTTMRSMDTYFDDRSKGIKSTRTFFTEMANVRASTVKAVLRDISKEIKVFDVNRLDKIRPFVEKNTGKPMLKGAAFYQLVKMEKNVQDYKQIIIRDKKSGSVYSGTEARNLLGLPHYGNVKIVPGNHGQYDIFVQSTSVNRVLPIGTQLIYWENAGQPFTTV